MKDLSDWRNEIDAIDREILTLLNRRAECVLQLAPLKRSNNIAVFDPEREKEVHRKLHAGNQGPLSPSAVDQVFDSIMAVMRDLQHEQAASE